MIEVVGKLYCKDGRIYFVESVYPCEGTIHARVKQLGNWLSFHVPVYYLTGYIAGWTKVEQP